VTASARGPEPTDPRRALPSVGVLLDSPEIAPLLARAPRTLVTEAIRTVIDAARIDPSLAPPDNDAWAQAIDAQLAKLDKWWHRWERPKLQAKRPALQDAVTAADAALQAARARCENLEKAGAGDFPGLSVESRRAINIAAIACAEVLCLRLSRTNLVAAARTAMSKRESTEYYGDLAACVSIMSDIVKARNLLKQRAGITQDIAQRSERLRATAAYLGEFETVPIPESCAVSQGDVLTHGSQGVTAAKLPNVLAEDTWDLFKVLLR